MSTPVIERPGSTPGTRPTRRTAAPPRIPAQRGPGDARRVADARRRTAARDNTGRAKFVLVVMVLLVSGLVATLWLSTAAAADSYALQAARQRTAALTEQSEALRKEVSVLQSPGSLADRAAAQGMVTVTDPARLVVAPDGSVAVVGEPSAAVAAAPPAPAAPPAGTPAAAGAPAAPTAGDTADPRAEGGDAAAAAPAAGAAEGTEQEVPAGTGAAGGN
ncbi:septum formation initiator [Pseudonocardia spirodelae]|uniref:Septum formation initiator n=1 Tax=Pseudonocardia spirodelae TaxID=3133431 RepID=A0ABU8T1C9_9PSEU